jgi:hypothetical protein
MLKLVLRTRKEVAEPPPKPWLCVPLRARQQLHKMMESRWYDCIINMSIVLTVAILLLPTKLWPVKIAIWFNDINTAILILWTLEFLLKTVAYGFFQYFASAKMDCLVIPFLWSADVHAIINLYFPAAIASHFGAQVFAVTSFISQLFLIASHALADLIDHLVQLMAQTS